MSQSAEYVDITGVAKLIRAELKQQFPDTKFSVRSSRYSMGSNVRVDWTDGPAAWQVDKAIGHFGGRTFDGSDDSTHYHDSELNGKLVSYAGYGPTCQREVTNFKARHAIALSMIRASCHVTGEPGQERFGNDWIDNLASNMVHSMDFRSAQPLADAFKRVVLREGLYA